MNGIKQFGRLTIFVAEPLTDWLVHQFESRTISSMVQTWPAIPASIAGVTLKGLVNPSKVVPPVMQGNRMMQVINLF
jgi:hypothetical protein